MYCVYLTTYIGDKLPKYYVGSSSLLKIQNGYKGSVSSKEWKHIWNFEIKEHPELFSVAVVSKHNTRVEALNAELQYQLKHKNAQIVGFVKGVEGIYNESLFSITE